MTKPKVEPTSERMSPLFDKIDHAIDLLNCAYHATVSTLSNEDGDAVRAVMDEANEDLKDVKDALHDMIVWAG